MKNKLLVAIIISCSLISIKAIAQITFEQSYPGPNSPAWARLQLINMGNDEYKYLLVDFPANNFTLYNLDHTQYIQVPVPVQLINEIENNIGYVTRTLFDCDSSKFEYAVLPQNGNHVFCIYREDGTLLFQRDSTVAPYCLGCFGAAYDVRPIQSSPAGAKLFLSKNSPTGYMTTDVYSICGQLPVSDFEISSGFNSYVKIFPLPATGIVNFEFDFPSNTGKYEMEIFNASGQPLNSFEIPGYQKRFSFSERYLSPGLYFFTIKTENRTIQNGKFIIAK